MKRERTTRAPSELRFPAVVSERDWGGRVTRAEVNLDAIAQNTQQLAKLAAPADLMTVVKADAYGHGAEAVAFTALAHGANRLAVYTVSEGVALRAGGIAAPILVFGPFGPREAKVVWNSSLTPTVTSLEAASWLQSRAEGRQLRYQLKLDTGLARAGIAPEEAVEFVRAVRTSYPSLVHEGTYTHFVSADEVDKTTTFTQIDRFKAGLAQLERAGYPSALAHASNSAALLDVPAARFSLVRAGIATYGYFPSASTGRRVPLVPALQLLSEVTRVHVIPAGSGVGYGHEFRASRHTRIALVPVGYGDGMPRTLGHGSGRVLIHSQSAPIVARVSMDQITVDVTEIDDVMPGDEVVLIGVQGDTQQTAEELAGQAGTISYDILTGLLPRVPRVYVKGGTVVAALRIRSRLEQCERSSNPAQP